MNGTRSETRFIRRIRLPMVFVLIVCGCSARRTFTVVPDQPEYRLRAPDSRETPFPEVLDSFRDIHEGWVALGPLMELRLERAYFRDPEVRTAASYIGSETIRYAVLGIGALEEVVRESLPASALKGEQPVHELISPAQRRLTYHRLFLQVVIDIDGADRRAALVSGRSMAALDRLTVDLIRDPVSACPPESGGCTLFPGDVTAAPDVSIVVNGRQMSVPWTTTLARLVTTARSVEMRRLDGGVLTPVEVDPDDAKALEMPLLPGDDIVWD